MREIYEYLLKLGQPIHFNPNQYYPLSTKWQTILYHWHNFHSRGYCPAQGPPRWNIVLVRRWACWPPDAMSRSHWKRSKWLAHQPTASSYRVRFSASRNTFVAPFWSCRSTFLWIFTLAILSLYRFLVPFVMYFYHETNMKYVSYRLREINDFDLIDLIGKTIRKLKLVSYSNIASGEI
jgi:hypothetical protein